MYKALTEIPPYDFFRFFFFFNIFTLVPRRPALEGLRVTISSADFLSIHLIQLTQMSVGCLDIPNISTLVTTLIVQHQTITPVNAHLDESTAEDAIQ